VTENKEILFSGIGASMLKIPEFKRQEGGPEWWNIVEKAFLELTSTNEGKELYGDPEKGASLEQAWRTSGCLTGKWPVCLLATRKPSVATDEIKRIVRMNPPQIVGALADVLRLTDKAAAQILYYDGEKGHCITLLGYDGKTSRFIYHDPWPETSLLCKEWNMAGIDAQRADKYWSITAAELEKVRLFVN
jgi:hypothetical protein